MVTPGKHPQRIQPGGAAGYAMAALLVGLAIMSLVMSMLLPVWSQAAQREREAELVFRGQQYARAIELYQRQYAGAFPPDVDTLLEQRFLRRSYSDPMTADGEFQILYQAQGADVLGAPATAPRPGQAVGQPSPVDGSVERGRVSSAPRGGMIGVVSKSTEASLRIYNGGTKYSEWVFVHVPSTTQPGGAGGRGEAAGDSQRPGSGDGRPGGGDRLSADPDTGRRGAARQPRGDGSLTGPGGGRPAAPATTPPRR